MTTKLSLTARYLLTYIRFKTNNNHQFFANNATIAKVIGCTETSTKVIVNKLIRLNKAVVSLICKQNTYRNSAIKQQMKPE